MVHRRSGTLVVLAALSALAFTAAPAGATSSKVAISDFHWSTPNVTVAAGDTVKWFWIGPDTQHSITEQSPDAEAIDSDPGNAAPSHPLGDTFEVKFDQPGTYAFHCKLHAIVKGTVTVVDDPSQVGPSPDPDPQVIGDHQAPSLTDVRWEGRTLKYTLDERARLRMDVMQARPGVDRYLGGRSFKGHIGWNQYGFNGVLHNRKLKRGNYYVLLTAADAAGNRTGDVRVPLQVRR